MNSMSESHWLNLSYKNSEELRLYDVGLELDNFEPRLISGIFKCITWLIGSFLGGDDRGFLKEGVKTYI